jgi:hypothetical protein
VLGASIGSGEFLLGPASFVRYGLSLLWITGVAIFFQTILNTELMRYTVATGESIFTGFMRTRPSASGWAWVYALLAFLQVGWPAWAATAAGAVFFLGTGRIAGASDSGVIYLIGVGTFLISVSILLIGGRIARTLEVLNWILVTFIIGGFLLLGLAFVPGHTWVAAALGFIGFDAGARKFAFLPSGADFFLLGALVAYSGAGGVLNLMLSGWARDKGYGMGSRCGYIASAVGGEKVNVAHTGFMFTPDAEGMRRWRGWWRIVRVDQWGIFFVGAVLGMALPALLYVTFVPSGTNIVGLGIAAVLANSMASQHGVILGAIIGFIGTWVLFKTQLDVLEGATRSVTDMLWSGSERLRRWRGGDVRAVYYSVLAVIVAWGCIALRLAQPVVLLQVGANVAGVVLIVASLHVLYVNTRLLPPQLRPPLWRRLCLVGMAIFYGFFAYQALASLR